MYKELKCSELGFCLPAMKAEKATFKCHDTHTHNKLTNECRGTQVDEWNSISISQCYFGENDEFSEAN